MRRQLCAQCHAELEAGSRVCAACGTSRLQSPSSGRAVFALVGLAVLLLAVLLVAVLSRGHRGSSKDEHVAAELQPGLDRAALEIPGVMRVMYLDLGNKIQLSVMSKFNPILYFDVNQDHALGVGDVSYAPLPDNRVCVGVIGRADNSVCDALGSLATAQVTQAGDVKTVTWQIPKSELSSVKDSADIVIRAFHENTQDGEYYPAVPFEKVYRLIFRKGETAATSSITPLPSAAPHHAPSLALGTNLPVPAPSASQLHPEPLPGISRFEATPDSIVAGGATRLRWAVQGRTTSIEIQPDLGAVAAQGERDITPSATTRYVLSVKGPGGASSRELTVAVGAPAPPAITSFSSDAAAVAPGGVVRLRWNVTGAVNSVKIDPGAGGMAATGYRDVTVSQTTNFVITAAGPGGAVSETLTIRAVPPTPTIAFDSAPATVRAGEPVALHWAVTGSTQVSIHPGFGDVSPNGSEILHPLVTTQYTIVANAAGGSAAKSLTVTVSRPAGPSRGQLVWSGDIHGTELVTIDGGHADIGSLEGTLPGLPCIVQPVGSKNVSIASSPGPRNQYQHLVLRVRGNGPTKVVIDWVLQ